jgi:hypothetical protein
MPADLVTVIGRERNLGYGVDSNLEMFQAPTCIVSDWWIKKQTELRTSVTLIIVRSVLDLHHCKNSLKRGHTLANRPQLTSSK